MSDDRRQLNRSWNERIAYLIDGLAQSISGVSRAAREANALQRSDGATIEQLQRDINRICQQLEIVLVAARMLLK